MHHERRADLLPPYAAQSHLAAMIWFRAFTACGLGKEEWRPLVGMLCFRNQATIWVKSQTALYRITKQGKERGEREIQEWLPFRNQNLGTLFTLVIPLSRCTRDAAPALYDNATTVMGMWQSQSVQCEEPVKIRVRVGTSRIAGQGLFAAQDITKGTSIIQYTGERLPKPKAPDA